MRELAIQAANGTLTTTDRATIDAEFQQLIAEIDRVAGEANFNGLNLLDGSVATIDLQVGVNAGDTITVTMVDGTALTLGVSLLDVTTAANASTAAAMAPAPCKARPMMTPSIVSDTAATTLPTANSSSPPAITGLRPIRSESLPSGI